MLFNSYEFLIFFPVVTVLYFALPFRLRWMLLLAASCIFYMYFIPIYILILALTIVIDFFAGILIEQAHGARRRALLAVSLVANVGVLAVFKYFNFINDNVAALARLLDWNYPVQSLTDVVLPIGLSFHTFQAMSYTIEVYNGRQKAERHFGIYALYVMFYPQLVAGPIERPQNLLPQLRTPRGFDYERVVSGLKLMVYGLFLKMVVADRLAMTVNVAFGDARRFSGPALALATVFFAFQIFCDFAGYSSIAIGAARVMGIELMRNFNSPYHAASVAEFWRRWHISLSTWFRDYVYVPLGGNQSPRWRWALNIMIVFLISGLWHGANWTYVIWGGLHGLYICFGRFTESIRKRIAELTGIARFFALHRTLKVAVTFLLVCIGWIFFRANSVGDAWHVLSHLGSGWGKLATAVGRREAIASLGLTYRQLALAVLLIVSIEALHALQNRVPLGAIFKSSPVWVRWSVYVGAVLAILNLGVTEHAQFIYFQF